jgi:hypothetical protein
MSSLAYLVIIGLCPKMEQEGQVQGVPTLKELKQLALGGSI